MTPRSEVNPPRGSLRYANGWEFKPKYGQFHRVEQPPVAVDL